MNIASFIVVAGGLIGGALIEYFSAMLTDNTIESAKLMADEGDKMLSTPGVLEGKVKPDYNKLIGMAANQALKKMVVPSVLALCIPVIGGFIFGVQFVGGILIGATIVAIPRALFMGNSGGAFDNAKKYIESEALEGHGKAQPLTKQQLPVIPLVIQEKTLSAWHWISLSRVCPQLPIPWHRCSLRLH